MGVKDWIRRFVPFHRRNLSDEKERSLAIQDAIEYCQKARAKSGDSPNFEETDSIFDELLDAFNEYGLNPASVWKAADKAFPDNPRWLEALASHALAQKTTDRETLQILRRQSERSPDHLPLLLRLIDCYRAEGDEYMEGHVSSRALSLAKQFLTLPADTLPRGISHSLCEALVENLSQNLARIYLSMGREDDEALHLFVRIIERDVTQTDYLGVVSRKFMADNRTDEKALGVYEEALAFDPENADLQRYIGKLYLDSGRTTEGLAILRAMANAATVDQKAEAHLVEYLVAQPHLWNPSDPELILKYAREFPEKTGYLDALSGHFLEKEDVGNLARETCELAIKRNIRKTQCLRFLAGYYADRREWERVIDCLEATVDQEGAYQPDILLPLATAYGALNRSDDKAIHVYEGAIHAGTRLDTVHEAYCRYLYLHRRGESDALLQFRRTLDVFPECKWAVLGIVREHIQSKDYVLAFEEALAQMKRDPSDREVLHYLALSLAHEPNPRLLAQLRELGKDAIRAVLWKAYDEKPSARRIAVALARTELQAAMREPKLVPILRTAIHIEPDDPEMITGLSECLWKAGRQDEGAEVDEQMISWLPNVDLGGEAARSLDERQIAARQAAMRLSGYYARHNVKSPRAIKNLWKACDLRVCADEAVVYLAHHVAASGGHSRRELDVLSRALELQPRDSVLRMALIRVRAARGEVDEALRWCITQLRTSPRRRVVRDLLREVVEGCNQGDLTPQVLGQLRGLCSANPDDQELAEIAAHAHQVACVTNPQVRAIFETAFGARPTNPEFLANLARSYLDAGDERRAAQQYAQLLEVDPRNEEAVRQLAIIYSHLHRRSPQALQVLDRAIALDPDNFDLCLYKAELLLDMGKTQPASEILQKALLQNPERMSEALNLAERFRQYASEDRHALLLLARLYTHAGEPDEALHTLDALLEIDSSVRADVLPLYDQLVEQFSENVRARLERASLLKLLGRHPEAVEALESLIEDEGAAHGVLAELAETLQLQIQSQKTPDPDLLRKLARIQLDLGESDTAVQTVSKTLGLVPDDMKSRMVLVHVEIERGNLETALDHLEKCPPSPESIECLRELSRLFERKKQWEKAAHALRKVLESGQENMEDRSRLDRLELRHRQEKAARSAKATVEALPPVARERYELLQQIVPEAHHSIFRAYDRKLDEVVALKFLAADQDFDPVVSREFTERAESIQQVRTPRIVRHLDLGIEAACCFLTMEYITGGDLAVRLQRSRGSLPIPEVRKLALDLAEAFDLLHKQQLIHGRISPRKVLYGIDGRPKLTGILSFPEVASTSTNTPEETLESTLSFRAPEQTEDAPPHVSHDIYGFGAVLYNVTAGRPFNRVEIREETVEARIRRAGPVLSAVIAQCLSSEPQKRFPSFQPILEILQSG